MRDEELLQLIETDPEAGMKCLTDRYAGLVFSYSKTAEVPERRINQALLEGNELSGEIPALSEIEDLRNTLYRWEYIDGDGNAFLTSPEETVGVQYFRDREKIKRYENGKEVWSVKMPEEGFFIGFTPVSDGVVVMYSMGYGESDRLIKVSDRGEVLWNICVDNGFGTPKLHSGVVGLRRAGLHAQNVLFRKRLAGRYARFGRGRYAVVGHGELDGHDLFACDRLAQHCGQRRCLSVHLWCGQQAQRERKNR